jgi:magnesium transporter
MGILRNPSGAVILIGVAPFPFSFPSGRDEVKLVRKKSKEVGLSPGSLIHIGDRKIERPRISLFDYSPEEWEEKILVGIEESIPLKETSNVTWVNIDGIHQIELLEQLGAGFELHPLVLEDILDTEHRPKIEEYDNYLFIVLKMLSFDEQTGDIHAEQVSLILGPSFVLSFQEQAGDVFEGVRKRIRNGKGRIRSMGADYLAYALIDSIVDSYFLILEKIGDRIELLEEELIRLPTPATLQKIHRFKRQMILLRRSIWPLREIVKELQRDGAPLIRETTDFFLRDVYDHTIQIVETVETFRDIISGMIDIYLSNMSNRMNEVMKVLTIIATIFIPLTFIAGVYGMNFAYMPELEWRWGYPAIWLLMLAIFAGMMIYFKKKKWL